MLGNWKSFPNSPVITLITSKSKVEKLTFLHYIRKSRVLLNKIYRNGAFRENNH